LIDPASHIGHQLKELQLQQTNNSRSCLVHGHITLFTPAFFGDGKKKAKPILEKAVSLYNSFKAENDLIKGSGHVNQFPHLIITGK
jgi:hypothetical protein